MIETNIRIVGPGTSLFLAVRKVRLEGPGVTAEAAERACGRLRSRYHLAATRCPGSATELLVLTREPVPNVQVVEDGVQLDIKDMGSPGVELRTLVPEDAETVRTLIERALQAKVSRSIDYWTLDSPRIFWERTPFITTEEIVGYRRFEVAALWLPGVGVGIAVDVSTAFLTAHPLSHFLYGASSVSQQAALERRFVELSGRQDGQKGTLVYDNSVRRVSCYFESAVPDLTCGSQRRMQVDGVWYSTLLEYYKKRYPKLAVNEQSPVVRVSFRGIDKALVASDQVCARVMNDNLPEDLSSVDKLAPRERRDLIQKFWNTIGSSPLGSGVPVLKAGFWRPDADRVRVIPPPPLAFGRGQVLLPPADLTVDGLSRHYRDRLSRLARGGCYLVPSTLPRTVHFAIPDRVPEPVANRFAEDVLALLSEWTGSPLHAETVRYAALADGIAQLRRSAQSGIACFVLNREPAAYHEVAFQLEGWRLKRVTDQNLLHQHRKLTRDRGGAGRWRTFVTLNALDLAQIMDVVPYAPAQTAGHEAHLAVDVGHDRRYIALSLMIARGEGRPAFRLATLARAKADIKHDAINPVFLADYVWELVSGTLGRGADPIRSILVLRDGRLQESEIQGLRDAVAKLIANGFLTDGAAVTFAEIHKDSLNCVRFWEVADSTVCNPLEGTAVKLDDNHSMLATTGAATLRQGTADPLLVVARNAVALDQANDAVVAGSNLNWSSPQVAQRLPAVLRRTDDELTARASQEIRRLK